MPPAMLQAAPFAAAAVLKNRLSSASKLSPSGRRVSDESTVVNPMPSRSNRLILKGRVRTEDNRRLNFSDLRVVLESRDDPEMGSASVSVKADGTFVVKNVTSEVYDVTLAGAPEDFYLKAARLDSDNVLEAGLSLALGREPGTLELLLSSAGGQIDGIVTSEQQGFDSALVVLVPEPRHRGQARLYKTTTTDQYGHFTLRGIAPGDYKLFAWKDIEAGAYYDADFLRPYEERGETVRVVEAGRHGARLKLISVDGAPR